MTALPASFITPLPDLTVIDVRGADAATFLHGQLTQDMTGLPTGQARLAGYCSPKGRLLATLVAWRTGPASEPGFRVLVRSDLADALLKRLRMFVLRAHVQLLPVAQAVLGVTYTADDSADAIALPWALNEAPDATTWAISSLPQGTAIAAPRADDHTHRWWWLPAGDAIQPHAPPDHARWQAADIAAGLGWVRAVTSDTFLPQSLNLDLIDGLRFDKGCYPGQEVVARAHYRHAVKRRMAYLTANGDHVSGADAANTDIYQTGAGLACGRVIDAAVAPSGNRDAVTTHLLVELALAAWTADDLRLGSAEGIPLVRQPLPYVVPGT